MNKFAATPTQGKFRSAFKLNPVAAGCAVFVSAMASSAFAQEAAPAATQAAETPVQQVVTVTGIRRGIEAAIDVKKNSSSIVEAISAEDIGKLPDSSIAESIARLPGLTAQRVAGRAQNISIRGMSGDFSTALLNGREQVSTGDNRGVEFDQYPSELLAGVVVYKTPDAALVGQGLSGTVDLQTVRPLAFGKRTFAVNMRGEKSGIGTDFTGKGKRLNLSYIDQFANRTIGLALGYARLQSDVQTSRAENYDTNQDYTHNGSTIKIVNGFKLFNDSTSQTRDGFMGVLEFKPSKQFSSMVDLYYSKFDKDVVKRGLEIQVNDSWKAGNSNPAIAAQAPALTNAVITGGKLISGTWQNVNPLSRHIAEPRKDELKALGWNTKLKFAEKWTAIGDLSFSKADRKEEVSEIEAGAASPESVSIINSNTLSALQFDHGNPSIIKLTDPESWGQNGYHKVISTTDKIKAARLGLERDMDGMFRKVSVGVNFSDRSKDKNAAEYKLILKTPLTALPGDTQSVRVGGSQFNSVSFTPSDVLPSAYNLVQNLYADIFLKSWNVTEKATTAFVKGELDTEVFGFGLRGNIGVQAVHTNQHSTAPQVDTTNQSVATLTTQGKTYTDFLPSANLAFDLGHDQTLRFGVARVMARARMDQMSAGRRAEVDQNLKWNGSGGNPQLDPFRANALDISYEKYFGSKAYISAAAFHKNLKSYIFDFTDRAYAFNDFPNLSGRVPLSNIGTFKQPRNGSGGSIKGVELAASVPFNLITPALDGFGIVGSYANTSSKIAPFGDADTRPLPGLSKRVTSLAVYYEKYGFSTRVAQRTRSDFLGEVTGFGAGREYTYIKGEKIIDVQLGYEVQSGFAKGVSFMVQVNNANDAVYQRYADTPDNIIDTIKYGKTVLFGANYKF
ncbi:MAG: TonB-dependent receptor [Pseudomonadota bacterium]